MRKPKSCAESTASAMPKSFGPYRRLHILLQREDIEVNHKKLFRLYREERLLVRTGWSQARPGTEEADPGARQGEPALVTGLRL